MKIFRILLLVLCLTLTALLTYDGFFIARVIRDVRMLRNEVESVRIAYESNRIPLLLNTIVTMAPEIASLNEDLQRPILIPQLPYLNTNVTALKTLVYGGNRLVQDLVPLAKSAQSIIALLPPSVSHFEDVPKSTKREILKRVGLSAPLWATLNADLQETQAHLSFAGQNLGGQASLASLNHTHLLKPLPAYITKAQDTLALVAQRAQKLQSLVNIVPRMVGYPDAQSYLLLFMNNFELRPGGGFIGTYGVAKVEDGDVQQLITDDIYNLDRPSHRRLTVAPPEPIKKYLLPAGFPKWLLRDSNWSPDFTINAQRALSFYRLEEGAHASELGGVIALTPNFIAKLLELTGPITIDGETFTADNVFDALEWRVEKGYVGKRIPSAQRKEIIGPFANALKTAVLRLPLSQWNTVLDVLTESLQQRHLMAWTLDPSLNSALRAFHATGPSVVTTPQNEDFLMVLDANMRALKTDQVMQKSITYEVHEQPNTTLSATVKIHYKNTGTYSWKWGTYRSYTRILVPEGSILMGNNPAQEVGSELHHTTFGQFFTLNPGGETTLTFTYQLPSTIADTLKDGAYRATFLKQAGTVALPLTFKLTSAKITKQIETDLRVDRKIVIK